MQKSYNEIQNEAIKIFKLQGKHPRTWSPADVQAVDSYVSRQISKQGFDGIDPRVAALYKNADMDAMGRHQALQKFGAEQGASDAINNMWGDFGGGDGLGAYNSEYDPYADDYTKNRDEERNQIRDQDEEKPEMEDDAPASEKPEEPTGNEGETPEPGLGEDASAPKPKAAGEAATEVESAATKTVPSLGQAGNAAKVAGGATEGAGAVAGATGAAGAETAAVATAGAAAPEFLIVVIVLGVIFLVLLVLWGIFAQNPSGNADASTNCVSSDGHVFPLPKDQINYSDGFGDNRSDHLHSGTDIMHKKDLKLEVYAIVDGNIVSSGTDAKGAYLKLMSTNPSDKNYYFYTHFSSILVAIGDTVTAGQLIGYSGGYNEGANGDHIHLSVGTTSKFKVNLPLDSGAAHGQTAAPSPYETTLNPYPILKAIASGTETCNDGSVGSANPVSGDYKTLQTKFASMVAAKKILVDSSNPTNDVKNGVVQETTLRTVITVAEYANSKGGAIRISVFKSGHKAGTWHEKGYAFDIGNEELAKILMPWLKENSKSLKLNELIFDNNTAGVNRSSNYYNLDEGVPHNYNSSTLAGHRDHIHIATY